MTAEEQAAHAARVDTDNALLRQIGAALEAEATRRRNAGEAALDLQSAAAVVVALTA